MMRNLLTAILAGALLPAAPAFSKDGFYVVFPCDASASTEPSIMATSIVAPRDRNVGAGWRLRMVADDGGELASAAMGNPLVHGPSEGSSAACHLVGRIADRPDAAALELIGTSGDVVWQARIDEGFRRRGKETANRVAGAVSSRKVLAARAGGADLIQETLRHLDRRGAKAQPRGSFDAHTSEIPELGPAGMPAGYGNHLPRSVLHGNPNRSQATGAASRMLAPVSIHGPMLSAPSGTGSVISGQIVLPQDVRMPGTMRALIYTGDTYVEDVDVDVEGSFRFRASPDREYRMWLPAPAPLLPGWHALEVDHARRTSTLKVGTGVILTIRPYDEDGSSLMAEAYGGTAHVAGAEHYFGFSTDPEAWTVAVPSGRDVVLNFHTSDDLFKPDIGPRRFTADEAIDVEFKAIRRLTGTVRRSDGTPHPTAVVRAYDRQTGAYVVSTRSDADGGYQLLLRPGDYDIEVDARNHQSSINLVYMPRFRAFSTQIGKSDVGRDIELNLPSRVLRLKVAGARVDRGPQVALETEGRLLAKTFVYKRSEEPCTEAACEFSMDLLVAPGTYDVAIETIASTGLHVHRFADVDLRTADAEVALNVALDGQRWSADLLDDTDRAVSGGEIVVFDDTGLPRDFARTGASGGFSVAAKTGWTIEVGGPSTGRSLRRRFVVEDPGALPAKVVLPTMPEPDQAGPVGTQPVFVGRASERASILYLGDGFTEAREQFDDRNGNGVWDGVLWHDLDADGAFDPDEPYAVYGDAAEPVAGNDPTRANEPFEDTNEDGVPSFDDYGVLVLNATNHMRALLGTDYWHELADTFEAHVAFVASAQAGPDVIDRDGNHLVARDTLLGGGIELQRGTLVADREAAMLLAEQLLPGFDYLVLVLNEPIPYGRANTTIGTVPGSMLIGGGTLAQYPNSPTPGHEAGHFFGLLADEYYEFPTTSDGREPHWANVTTRLHFDDIKWKRWLNPQQPLPSPTVFPEAGPGLFEGAYYEQGGVYRPSWNSIMRSGIAFDPWHRAELDRNLARFTTLPPSLNQHGLSGNWFEPATNGQGMTFQVFPDQIRPGRGLLFAGWFTYDTQAGGPERLRWYTLSGEVDEFATSADLQINVNEDGRFDAPPATAAERVGYAQLRIEGCDSLVLDYRFADGRTGAIPLQRLLDAPSCVRRGTDQVAAPPHMLSGNWFDPETSGQGFMLEASTGSRQLFGTWFTYAGSGAGGSGASTQRWYAFQGSLDENGEAGFFRNLTVYLREGGRFDDPQASRTVAVGTADLQLESCHAAIFDYRFDAGENAGMQGRIELQRLGPAPASCND